MKLLNRVLPVFICILLIFAFLPGSASAEADVIEGDDFGNGVTWELTYDDVEEDNGVWALIICGNGEMPDMGSPLNTPWYNYVDLIDIIVVGEGVTSVGDYAFANCWHVTSVSLPQSLEKIGTWGFGRCSSLSSITIPSACAYIGGAAFQECESLSSIIVPSACSYIGDEAFRSCAVLRSVTFEGNAPDIGSNSFYGVTAAAWCSCQKEGWDENTMLQYGAEQLTWSTHAYDEGVVITEAGCTTDGVIRYTCNICEEYYDEAIPAKGHTEEIDPAVEPDDENDGLTEGSHCSVCGEVIIAQEVIPKTGYIVDLSSIPENKTVEINGKIISDIAETVISSTESDAPAFAIVYDYGESKGADQIKQYPASMKVYRLSRDVINKTCSAEELKAYENLLVYTGFSIRTTGVPGIRMITSVRESLKKDLIETGIDKYKLVEYGTLVQWESALAGGSLTFETEGVKYAPAYEQGKRDPVFARAGGYIMYTNVIVGFKTDECNQDLAMRPYMKFRNDEGKEMVIYGGTVSRSIGYIALQNKDAFKPGTKEYEYIWSLIRAAYDDEYAGSYKKS